MKHPADLRPLLEDLDPFWVHALDHLLQCPECSTEVRQMLSEGLALEEALTPRKLARLQALTAQVRRDLEETRRFLGSLQRRRTRAHVLVRSRLECLVADHLSPAVRDLESILENARGNYDAGLSGTEP